MTWLVGHYTQQADLRVNFKHSGTDGRFDPSVENAAYRIVQEGLTNVVRRAKTSQAKLVLSVADGVLGVLIEDKGVGFDPQTDPGGMARIGLAAMRERVATLGWVMTVDAVPGEGTSLWVELPLEHDNT